MDRFFLMLFLIFFVFQPVMAGEWDPSRAALESAQRKLDASRPRTCAKYQSCASYNLLDRLESEDYSSKFFGLLKSRAPSCQAAVDKMRNPTLVNKFSSSLDLQRQFAQVYSEIGAVNNQRIQTCAKTDPEFSRYKISKFYHYMARLNNGATRAYEELSAISALLGDNDPLACEGRGTIDQAYNRCQKLSIQCKAKNSQLADVAKESALDEAKYKEAKAEVENIQRKCLYIAADYKKYAAKASVTNPVVERCEDMLVGRTMQKFCTNYSFKEKQKIAACALAQDGLKKTIQALEDKNPWFRSENYFKLRQKLSVEQAIRQQMLNNRSELKKKVREFRNAGLCVNGFQSSQNCDTNFLRTTLAATPKLEVTTYVGRTGAAHEYLNAQQCIEDGVTDQIETAKVLNGLAIDAVLTIATAGLSGIATGAKALMTARGALISRAAITAAASIDSGYALQSYTGAYKTCADKGAQSIAIAARAAENSCPGPQSNLSQAQKDYSSCVAAVGFAALDSLPGVPLLAATSKRIQSTVTVSEAASKVSDSVRNTANRIIPGRATRSSAAATDIAQEVKVPSGSQNKPNTLKDVDSEVSSLPDSPTSLRTPSELASTKPAPRIAVEPTTSSAVQKPLDVDAVNRAADDLNPQLSKANLSDFENVELRKASVVQSIATRGSKRTEGFSGVNNDGLEIRQLNGKVFFTKIIPAREEAAVIREAFFAKKMADMGIGPQFLGTFRGSDGKFRIATEFIDGTDLKIIKNGAYEEIQGDLKFVTDKTVSEIREINRKLLDAGINPTDLSFRINKNGKPFVIDPAGYSPISESTVYHQASVLEQKANVLENGLKKLADSDVVTKPNPTTKPPTPVLRGASSEVTTGAKSETVPTTSTAEMALKSEPTKIDVAANRQRLVDSYVGKQLTTYEQNSEWIRKASNIEPDGKSLFLIIENSVIKNLNDTSLDKDFITALTNKNIELNLNKILKKYNDVALPASDFKTLGFRFDPKPPATQLPEGFKKDAMQILSEVNSEFADFVRANGFDKILGDPSNWFRSGFGRTADWAEVSARQARNQADNHTYDFDDPAVQEALKKDLYRIESLRSQIASDPTMKSLVDKSSGPATLKTEVFEIVRKTNSAEELIVKVRKLNGVDLSPSQAQRVIDYSKDVNTFSLSPRNPARENASITEAEFGGMTIDFKGLGAENLSETAKALARSKTPAQAAQEARLAERAVTARLNVHKLTMRKTIQDIADKNGYKIEIRVSGDDMVVIPKEKEFTPQIQQQISEALVRNAPPVRVSTIPAGVAKAERGKLAAIGEDFEKDLRVKLSGKIPRERLDQILFSVDMRVTPTGGKTAQLRTSTKNMFLSPEEKKMIDSAFANTIEEINNLPSGYISADPKKVRELDRIEAAYPTSVPVSLDQIAEQQRAIANQNRLLAQAAKNQGLSENVIATHWKSAAKAQEKSLAQEIKTNYRSGEVRTFFSRYSDTVYSGKPTRGQNQRTFDEQSRRIREIQRRFDATFNYYMQAGDQEKAKEVIMRSPLLQNSEDPDRYFNGEFMRHYRETKTAVGAGAGL
ncbi:MAG: hypothetical protein V4654_03070 [Bdellovibrionota bacterium]